MTAPRKRKLADEEAHQIRVDYARGWKNARQLAREYGVSAANIFLIVQGMTYKYAGGPITWPDYCGVHQHPLSGGQRRRGYCRADGCAQAVAPAGVARRMRMCDDCYRAEKHHRLVGPDHFDRDCPSHWPFEGRLIRVFPRRTKATPTDALARFGPPSICSMRPTKCMSR
jgi:hypothetical protein